MQNMCVRAETRRTQQSRSPRVRGGAQWFQIFNKVFAGIFLFQPQNRPPSASASSTSQLIRTFQFFGFPTEEMLKYHCNGYNSNTMFFFSLSSTSKHHCALCILPRWNKLWWVSLHLLVFPFIYQFNSRIGVLVNSSFTND